MNFKSISLQETYEKLMKKASKRKNALIKEEQEHSSQEQENDSLDAQIDKYFIQYEESSKSSDMKESFNFSDMTRKFLNEAAGPSDEKDDTDAEPTKSTLDDIDVEAFANEIVRLIENYDNLLEVRNTIVRRAVNFLNKNYEDTVSVELQNVLRDDHGIDTKMNKFDSEDDRFPSLPAARSGLSSAGT